MVKASTLLCVSYQELGKRNPGWLECPKAPRLISPIPAWWGQKRPCAADLRPALSHLSLQRASMSGEKPGLPTVLFWPRGKGSLLPWNRSQGNLGKTSALDRGKGMDVTGSLIYCVPRRRPAAESGTAASGRNQHTHCPREGARLFLGPAARVGDPK